MNEIDFIIEEYKKTKISKNGIRLKYGLPYRKTYKILNGIKKECSEGDIIEDYKNNKLSLSKLKKKVSVIVKRN